MASRAVSANNVHVHVLSHRMAHSIPEKRTATRATKPGEIAKLLDGQRHTHPSNTHKKKKTPTSDAGLECIDTPGRDPPARPCFGSSLQLFRAAANRNNVSPVGPALISIRGQDLLKILFTQRTTHQAAKPSAGRKPGGETACRQATIRGFGRGRVFFLHFPALWNFR